MNDAMRLLFRLLSVVIPASTLALAVEAVSVEPSGAPPRATVSLMLLDAPSGVQTTTDLASLGTVISHQSQLAPGTMVFLEAWCQTPGPNGITTAVIDLTYETTFLDTSVAQIVLASQWGLLPFDVSVDDGAGLVDDLGGNDLNLSGLAVAPEWAKVGTVEFDVTSASADPVVFCSHFAGGFLKFAIRSEGAVDPSEVDYGCFMVGCEVDADCDDGDLCTDDTCDPQSGCVYVNNTVPCNDGNACTTDDACADGTCVGGPPLDCDDGNVCTDDSCDSATGCVHVDNTDPCDDGDACTTDGTCSGGVCIGGPPLDCNDQNVCTDDSCDPATGCVYVNNTDPCDDGDVCTTNDMCSDGTCVGGSPLDCDDQNVCTDDSCDPATGCVYVNNTNPCDDGDACTTADTCSGGVCVGGPPLDCDDQNVCTDDSCDPATGCVYVNNTDPCDDGDACTTDDTCSDGVCIGGPPLDCDDQNVCTDDSCDQATGCVYVDNADPCDDEDACTTNDTCSGGVCVGGPPLDCDDQNVCTDDSCAPATGCVYVNNTDPCDDGDACTTNDMCSDGTCVGGPPLDCNDQNVCTDDSCAPATGCVYVNNADSCDDGDACTTNDMCSDGTCVGGPLLDCDDQNVCTDDSCDPGSGCVNTPVPGRECDDSDACTTQDTCNDTGACIGGPPPDCDDGNVCTDDSCDPGSGCVHAPLDCDDGNPCTDDTCNPEIGCIYTPVDGHPEMITVAILGLTGAYDWDIQRDAEVSLGFSLFEIGCVAIQWAGWINTGTFDCFGTFQGLGGQFVATFIPESFAVASFEELDERANFTIPFDRTDPVQLQSGGTFDFILDGSADIRVSFPPYSQECPMVYSPIGMLNSVSLVIAAHRMHDFDTDGAVDLDDMNAFDSCMGGPEDQLAIGCEVFDSDRDVDVDLADFAAFQVEFTGEP